MMGEMCNRGYWLLPILCFVHPTPLVGAETVGWFDTFQGEVYDSKGNLLGVTGFNFVRKNNSLYLGVGNLPEGKYLIGAGSTVNRNDYIEIYKYGETEGAWGSVVNEEGITKDGFKYKSYRVRKNTQTYSVGSHQIRGEVEVEICENGNSYCIETNRYSGQKTFDQIEYQYYSDIGGRGTSQTQSDESIEIATGRYTEEEFLNSYESVFGDSIKKETVHKSEYLYTGIKNLANGEIAADSHDAVTGSQLYAVQQLAAKGQNYFSANISHETLSQDALTTSAKARGAYSIAIGVNAETDASSSIVLGNNAFAWDASTSIAIGKDATISNVAGLYTDGLNGYGNLAFGRSTLVQNGRHNMAIGSGSQVIGNSTSGVMGGMALGMYSKVTGANYGIAIGRNASVDSARAWASIALGEASVVTGSDILSSDKRGVLSVGNSSSGITRRIINVSDGVNDHDAVNMSQLNELRSMIEAFSVPTVYSLRATSVSEGQNTVSVDGEAGLLLDEVSNDQGGTEYVLSLDPNREITAKSAVFNEGAANQVSINDEGVVVGKNSSVMNKDGFFAGGHSAETATAYMANGVVSVGADASQIVMDGNSGTVSVGETIKLDGASGQISGVAQGQVSAESTDAVNGAQLYETQQMIGQNASNIQTLNQQINKTYDKVQRVGAGAAALAALRPQDFSADHPVSGAVGLGHYDGKQAIAVGMFYRPTENLTLGFGASAAGNDDYMMNAGISYRFGGGGSYNAISQSDINQKVMHLETQNRALIAQIESANAREESTNDKLSKLAQENLKLKAEIEEIKKILKMKD